MKIIETLKRYMMALIFLLVVVLLMLLGTMGVTSFGNKMVKDIDIEMNPRGEQLNK